MGVEAEKHDSRGEEDWDLYERCYYDEMARRIGLLAKLVL
jgi:hypothetical protein